ncbi:MAG: STAS domain-containing protein, partial [Pseudomonadota bacterium]
MKEAQYTLSIDPCAFDDVCVRLFGRISVENADTLLVELLEIIEGHPLKNVVVDLQEVEYLDSAGAAVLMEARARCKEMNNTLETANAAGPTHKL